MVVASVHIADLGAGAALAAVLRRPRADGLRSADVGLANALRDRPGLSSPRPGRVALFAFWDDEGALDRFEATGPGRRLSAGWSSRLHPLRAYGAWPGLPATTPGSRVTDHDGPAVVLTLGRVRPSQLGRFLRTSAPAERAATGAAGFVWGTAAARPPFVATCSLWESAAALSEYAYGARDAPHTAAIAADRAEPFHRRSAFIRFRAFGMRGALGGVNPLPAEATRTFAS